MQAEEICNSMVFGLPTMIFYIPGRSEAIDAIENSEAAFAALCQVYAHSALVAVGLIALRPTYT